MRIGWAVFAAAVGLSVAAAPPVEAQASIRIEVDTARVTIGDRITLSVTVEHRAAARVVWPDSLDLAPFEVLEARVLPEEPSGESELSGAVFTLTVFELGRLDIPSFEVGVVDPDGSQELLATDRYGVEVVSVGADETGDIRGIRGPFGIPFGTVQLVLWALLPLAVAALLYAIARRLRPRAGAAALPALGPISRPAHEVALEALDALDRSPLLERGQVKEYHIEASDIVRTYVEQRFGVAALEMTSLEVLAGLRNAGVDDPFRNGLRGFLEPCDLVKFAKLRPGTDACRALVEAARRLVLDSVPRPSHPEGVQADAAASADEAVPAGVGEAP